MKEEKEGGKREREKDRERGKRVGKQMIGMKKKRKGDDGKGAQQCA